MFYCSVRKRMVFSAFLSLSFAVAAVLYWGAENARGDMIITIDSKSFQAESHDFFDVYIESSIDQNLLLASYKLAITPHVGNTASLFFRETFNPLDPTNINNQTNSEQNAPSYLFFGNADEANFSAVRQPDPLLLIGSDSEATNTTGVDLLAHQKYLLARIEVFTENPGTGTFTVNLIDDPAQTFFLDMNSNIIDIAPSSFDGTTFSISSVPEPSSMLLGLGGTLALGLFRYAKRRRARERSLS